MGNLKVGRRSPQLQPVALSPPGQENGCGGASVVPVLPTFLRSPDYTDAIPFLCQATPSYSGTPNAALYSVGGPIAMGKRRVLVRFVDGY